MSGTVLFQNSPVFTVITENKAVSVKVDRKNPLR